MVDLLMDLVARFLFLYTDFFFHFSLFLSVYVYASIRDLFCIALLLPFVLGFCLSVCFVLFSF